MNDKAEQPFYATRAARAPDETRNLYWLLLAATALVSGGLNAFIGFPKGGVIGADVVSRWVYLIGYASLPVVLISLLLAGAVTVALAWSPRRKDRRRGWFEDFAPLLLAAVVGGGIALAVAIGPSLRAAEAEVAVSLAIEAHSKRVNADNRAFDVELMESMVRTGAPLAPRRLSRDAGYRDTARIVAGMRTMFARQRKVSENRFAESRASLALYAKGKPWREAALASWDRRMAQDREVSENFYNGQEEILDSIEGLVRRLRASPGYWQERGYVFNRVADFNAFEADLKRHNALVRDVNQQAVTMGLSNVENINRATASVR
jgi:hypothetical protein